MSSDSEYNRRKSMDRSGGNIVENEVKKLFKENPHNISQTAMYKLRERYGDQELLDQIQDSFIERSREVRKRAKKFAKLITERYAGSNYPLHILLKKALKYKLKYKLSDAEFEEFRRVYELSLTGNEEPQHVNLTAPFTNLSRALGQGLVDVDDGMKFEDKDFELLQKIVRLYNETKATHAHVVLQSMSYRDLAPEALNGEFKREKDNPHCHIHPVVAALFLPKIQILENQLLLSNISYIIKQRYSKQPILTSTDYNLFYDLISDPTDVVCSNVSAVNDLSHRCDLQHHLWNNVLSLRNGRYYDCNYTNFMVSIDRCRRHVSDNPDLIYEGDEGTVLQRLMGAFSLRPTIVATSPLYTMMHNPIRTQSVIPKVTSIPMITLKLPSMYAYQQNQDYTSNINLEMALNMSQWYVEDGVVVPRNQQIIYSRGVLVFFVPRRAHTLNIARLVQPQNAVFNKLPRTIAGFDRLNDIKVDFDKQILLKNNQHTYSLKSVVVVDINIDVNKQNGYKLITGCSTLLRRTLDDDGNLTVDDTVFWYNPRAAALSYKNPKYAENNNEHPTFNSNPVHILDEQNSYGDYEDFYSKASTRGTIFVYQQISEQEKDLGQTMVF
jgi:hypothetical protein